ncbi:hypothetical protein D9M68_631170 [compost metagenome]
MAFPTIREIIGGDKTNKNTSRLSNKLDSGEKAFCIKSAITAKKNGAQNGHVNKARGISVLCLRTMICLTFG